MTHDLMNNIIDHVKVKLVRVVINKVEGDIIYSILFFTLDDSEVQIDSRPSDAIALALRAEAPIFVAREVFNAVGVKLGEPGPVPRFILRQGLTVQQMTLPLARYFGLESSEGVLVSDVKPGSPAEGAGLKTGDVIIEVNGQRIKSVRKIKSIFKEIGEGERITLLVKRGADSIPLVIHP